MCKFYVNLLICLSYINVKPFKNIIGHCFYDIITNNGIIELI